MTSNPLTAYRQTRVKTASQGQLIVMLYDEGIRQIQSAENELKSDKRKLDKVHNAIVKAQEIVTELTASLDLEKGGDIARNLFRLYMYFNQRLVDANMAKDASILGEVRELMADLREAWASIASTPVPSAGSAGAGINLAG